MHHAQQHAHKAALAFTIWERNGSSSSWSVRTCSPHFNQSPPPSTLHSINPNLIKLEVEQGEVRNYHGFEGQWQTQWISLFTCKGTCGCILKCLWALWFYSEISRYHFWFSRMCIKCMAFQSAFLVQWLWIVSLNM